MKNIKKIMTKAVKSDVFFENENTFIKEIDSMILKILVFEEHMESIERFLYMDSESQKIRNSSKNYILAILERAEYRIKILRKQDRDLLCSYAICLNKIKFFSRYIHKLEIKTNQRL